MTTPAEHAALAVQGVHVSYPAPDGTRFRALSDVSLVLRESEYVVVIGANGAGKSTLINAIAGAVVPEAGAISIDGHPVGRMSLLHRARLVSRVFQDPSVGVCGELTLEENLVLGMLKGRTRSPFRRAATKERRARAAELLRGYGRGLDAQLHQPAASLSGGQRQLVALTVAMAQIPRLLLLDEHTSALDPEIARVVMERTDEAIRERRLTTVMVTHNMRQAARYGDRLVIMSRGRIVDDIGRDEKAALGEDGLIMRFRSVLAGELTDRILG